jgi:hypothetical protein
MSVMDAQAWLGSQMFQAQRGPVAAGALPLLLHCQ